MGSDAPEVRKVVTVVFSDVVGSTALAERLDPETLRHVMGRYFAAMEAALARHGGTVEKFIGDAIMAVFGVPTVHEDDALRAVRAALAMREALATVNDELAREHGCRLETRTGVNTGEVVTGDVSSAQKLATGDAVNLAARLEQAAQPGEVLIGEGTHRLVGGAVAAEPLAPFPVAGKSDVVRAWRVLGVDPDRASARSDAARLVGRDRELAALLSAFDRVERDGTCALATVVAPPGIGKSRLARELAAAVGPRATVAVGRCLAYGEGITYAPLVEVVAALEDTGARVADLVAGTDDGPAIASRIAAALGRSDARVPPEEVAWAFRRLFEVVGSTRPLQIGRAHV